MSLCLARNLHETICLQTPAGVVEVTPYKINGTQVKLRITAPLSVRVYRKELDCETASQSQRISRQPKSKPVRPADDS